MLFEDDDVFFGESFLIVYCTAEIRPFVGIIDSFAEVHGLLKCKSAFVDVIFAIIVDVF